LHTFQAPRRRSVLCRAASLLVLAAWPHQGSAQDVRSEPAVGARVRVTLADSLRAAPFAPRRTVLVGTVARVTPESLVVLPPGASTATSLPRSTVRALAVSRGVSRWRSAGQQALIAGLTCGVAGYAAHQERGGLGRAAAWGSLCAPLGATIGTLRPYEHWRRVRSSR
jgi:hypothetical protein